MLTLLGENNAPSVATGLGVGESAPESKFMLIHCTVTTAIRPARGPSVGIVNTSQLIQQGQTLDRLSKNIVLRTGFIFLIVAIALGLITV